MKLLKKNTIANFIGLGYVTLINIVILPMYLKYLGAEAFGLVGFYLVLQSAMHLFDMGMSPMLSRQVAHTRATQLGFLNLKKLLRSLELIFILISIIVILTINLNSNWLVNDWLKVKSLPIDDVEFCILIMAHIITMRFFYSLYRSGIVGLEKQVWLNTTSIILVSLKVIGSLLLLIYVTTDIVHFFIFQFFVSLIELLVITRLFYLFLPSKEHVSLGFYWSVVSPVLPFAGGIAYASIIWIMLTQLDKVILSNILSLSDYGYFTIVIIVATGIIQLSSPISQAILPRMTFLLSQGKKQQMIDIYRQASRITVMLVFPVSGVVAFFSTEVLYAWTGDMQAARWAGPILFWFSLGNGILAVSSFQYYLQFAYGQLKWHVTYNSIVALIQIPLIVYAAFTYGAIGVAIVWFVLRLFSFLIWTPIIHCKFAPGIHSSWLFYDILPILVSTFITLLFLKSCYLNIIDMSRINAIMLLICIGLISILTNLFVSNAVRDKLMIFPK